MIRDTTKCFKYNQRVTLGFTNNAGRSVVMESKEHIRDTINAMCDNNKIEGGEIENEKEKH